MKRTLIKTAVAIAALALAADGQIATSQNFALEKAVVSNGGATSGAATFSVTGTAGQAAAGGEAASATYRLTGGFWSANIAPSAASVFVAGKVFAPDGRALRNAVVYLTDAAGTTRSARTTSFGYYRFEGIPAGQTVVIGVVSKLYRFEPRILSLDESVSNVDLTALGTEESEK